MKLPAKIKAFSLIELMVSVSIFVMMTTLTLTSYPESLIRTNLFNLSNNTVLLLREAQVKGSSINSARDINTGIDSITGYGVYFEKPSIIRYYKDLGTISTPGSKGDKFYTDANEEISTANISAGYYITSLCTTDPCETGAEELSKLTVNFTRPIMKAEISPQNDPANAMFAKAENACIELSTYKNPSIVRNIKVSRFGRVTSGIGTCPH